MHNTSNNNKRYDSTMKYIDSLSQEYSKLNVIRVDLSYKKPYSDKITIEEANKDLQHLFSNMRTKPSIFKDKVGYICKKEYTEDKGVHFHTVIIYDGQKTKQSAFKAEQIGEYWEKITKDRGSHHNCHRTDYTRNGIGILDYKDEEKRKMLNEDVLSYLCKDEQDIKDLKSSHNSKAYTRGAISKKKGNIGRPRKHS